MAAARRSSCRRPTAACGSSRAGETRRRKGSRPFPRSMNEDKAARYHRLQRQASIASIVVSLLVLGGLLATGWTIGLREASETAARTVPASWQAAASILWYVVLLSAINEAAGRPLGYYSGFLP